MGTKISAQLSMIAAPGAFSLFTAYQFLSSNELVSNPESKMRPYPSCVYQRVCSYMLEMIATCFFFAYCVSNFEFRFYFKTALHTAITDAVYCVKLVVCDRRVANKLRKGLDKALHKSYNATTREKEKSPNFTVRGCKFHSRSLNALVTHVRANIST